MRGALLFGGLSRLGSRSVGGVRSVSGGGAGPDQILEAGDHRAWTAESPVRLRLTETGEIEDGDQIIDSDLNTEHPGPQSMDPISVPSLLRQVTERLPDQPALRTRDSMGQPRDWTYAQYHEDISTVAQAFISLGLQPFHTVSVLGYPSPCQHIANMASVTAGGFIGGMYQTNTEEACQYIAEDSRANIIVVSDMVQLNKILAIRSKLPDLRAIVLYDDFENPPTLPGIFTWNQIMEIGSDQSSDPLNERLKNIAVNQCAVLGYTSGFENI